MNIRNAGGLIAFSVLGLLGVIGLATGHEHNGLIAVVIGGPAMIALATRLARRR